jgi:RAB protein geranylgeranyltransferase component A
MDISNKIKRKRGFKDKSGESRKQALIDEEDEETIREKKEKQKEAKNVPERSEFPDEEEKIERITRDHCLREARVEENEANS